MAGVSFAIGRLSAITGASSAAAGAALSGIGFTAAGLAAGLGDDFTSAGLPPLLACSAGWPSPVFALAALSAVLTDLLALFIARAPCCPHPRPKSTMFCTPAIRPRGRAFAFYV